MIIDCGIVGAGFVGGSLATVLSERNINIFQFDKAGKKSHGVNSKTFLSIPELVSHCQKENTFNDVIFLCLPTPMIAGTGECDISIVEGALKEIASVATKELVVVIKSTIPPGTCKSFNNMLRGTNVSVVHNPEFLRESSALQDMRNQDRIVIGGQPYALTRVANLYNVAFPDVPVIQTDSTTSEMVKCVANTFLATKVSYANEIYQICQKLNINYDDMIDIATMDKRLGDSHWQVPGPMPCDATGKPSFGFGGSCFPKDLNSLIFLAKKLGIRPVMLEATWYKNILLRTQKDWEKLKGRAVSDKNYKIIKAGRLPAIIEKFGKPLMDRIFGEAE